MSKCLHNKKHDVTARIACLEDTGRFNAEIEIKCGECGLPFQFLGLPCGLILNAAAMSPDALEARLAIAPLGAEPSPIDKGLLNGFRIRQSGDH